MTRSAVNHALARPVPANSANGCGRAPTGGALSRQVFDPDQRAAPSKPSATAYLLGLTLLACAFEGIFRKWVFPGSSAAVQAIFYFAKDAVFLCAALSALHRPVSSRQVRFLMVPFAAGTVLVFAAAVLASGDVRLIGGMLSLRSMIVIPWLALMAAQGLRSEKDIRLIIQVVGCVAFLNAALG